MILKFLLNFFSNPLQNASVIESSDFASSLMVSGINFKGLKCVVELGPGSGVFTDKYINKIDRDSKIFLFEIQPDYVAELKRKYADIPQVFILNEDASVFYEKLVGEYKYTPKVVISGIPFLYGRSKENLLKNLSLALSSGATIRMFTYMPFVFKKVYRIYKFKKIGFTFLNFPPFWVFEIDR